jgi:dihydrofolate reductase
VRISIIVAVAENGVIGADGGIPWQLPGDQAHFKQLTLGRCIVMGRGTHESIGRLLPGRSTIVVSRNHEYRVEGALVAGSLESAIRMAIDRGDEEVFVVGGAALYCEALPLADRLHLTRVHADVPGDVHFPDPSERQAEGWKLIHQVAHGADVRNEYAYTIQLWERSGELCPSSATGG